MGMIKRLNARLSALIEAAKSGPALSESREIIVLKAQIVAESEGPWHSLQSRNAFDS
jgi:hypothetical protein